MNSEAGGHLHFAGFCNISLRRVKASECETTKAANAISQRSIEPDAVSRALAKTNVERLQI